MPYATPTSSFLQPRFEKFMTMHGQQSVQFQTRNLASSISEKLDAHDGWVFAQPSEVLLRTLLTILTEEENSEQVEVCAD
jgi:hypothetical protein